MTKSIIEIQNEHGEAMYKLGLKHSLEMAKAYKPHAANPIETLIEYLSAQLDEREGVHDRFSSYHRDDCNDCRSAFSDFCQEQQVEQELDQA